VTNSQSPGSETTEYLICKSVEIPERGRILADLGGRVVGIFRVHGVLYAYENRCCHQGGPVCRGDVLGRWEEVFAPTGEVVSEGFSDTDIDIACPWHGWEYDLTTGKNIADPTIGLTAYPVEERDGAVYVLTELPVSA
jgi:nitrite reductase/ring-hydroxylating ferredoxin subunit